MFSNEGELLQIKVMLGEVFVAKFVKEQDKF